MVRIGSQLGTCASIAARAPGDNRLGAITKTASSVADRIETTFQVAKRSMGENYLFRLGRKRAVRRDP